MVSGCTVSGGTVTCNGTGFPTNNNPRHQHSKWIPQRRHRLQCDWQSGFTTLNQNHRISGMYFFGNNTGTVEDFPELQPKWRSDIHTRAQVVGGSWAWTPSPRWVNEAARRATTAFTSRPCPAISNTPASSYGLDTGVSGPYTGGLPRIGFGGYFFPGSGRFQVAQVPRTGLDHAIHRSRFPHRRQTFPQVRRRVAPQ